MYFLNSYPAGRTCTKSIRRPRSQPAWQVCSAPRLDPEISRFITHSGRSSGIRGIFKKPSERAVQLFSQLRTHISNAPGEWLTLEWNLEGGRRDPSSTLRLLEQSLARLTQGEDHHHHYLFQWLLSPKALKARLPFCSHNLKHPAGIFICTKKSANPSISLAKLRKEKINPFWKTYSWKVHYAKKTILIRNIKIKIWISIQGLQTPLDYLHQLYKQLQPCPSYLHNPKNGINCTKNKLAFSINPKSLSVFSFRCAKEQQSTLLLCSFTSHQ